MVGWCNCLSVSGGGLRRLFRSGNWNTDACGARVVGVDRHSSDERPEEFFCDGDQRGGGGLLRGVWCGTLDVPGGDGLRVDSGWLRRRGSCEEDGQNFCASSGDRDRSGHDLVVVIEEVSPCKAIRLDTVARLR